MPQEENKIFYAGGILDQIRESINLASPSFRLSPTYDELIKKLSLPNYEIRFDPSIDLVQFPLTPDDCDKQCEINIKVPNKKLTLNFKN